MLRYRFGAVAAGIVLPVVLLGGTSPALAHGKHGPGDRGHLAKIQGTIVGVNAGGNALQISTQTNGVVGVTLTSKTHVVRVVSGSLNDVAAKGMVDLHLVKGTTTVDAVRIDAVHKLKPVDSQRPPTKSTKSKTGTHPKPATHPTTPGSKGSHHPPNSVPSHVDGQVVTSSTSAITIADHHGKQTTYTFAGTPPVTMLLSGTPANLVLNEVVQIIQSSTGDAIEITILSA